MKRLIFEGPNWDGHWEDGAEDYEWVQHKGVREFLRILFEKPHGGHGGDEYGNCSLYFRCGLFGIIWFYPTGHYQTDVELPGIGENEWLDRVHFELDADDREQYGRY